MTPVEELMLLVGFLVFWAYGYGCGRQDERNR
jgi:hypothetical protein